MSSAQFLVFLLLTSVKLSCNKAITKPDAMKYLQSNGYLHSANNASNDTVTEALKNYQKFVNIERTGVLDKDTLKMMSMPRCGMPDNDIIDTDIERTWIKRHLTYDFQNYPKGLNPTKLKSSFDQAFAIWTRDIHLSVDQMEGEQTDMRVEFVNLDGNRIGHAFYPDVGNVSINASDNWSFGYKPNAYNINWVIVHEAGHSLGLPHNSDHNSVMHPVYQHNGKLNGTKQDHDRLMDAYGKRPLYVNNTLLCKNPKVDVLLTRKNNDILLIQGDKYWPFSERLGLEGGPLSIADNNLTIPLDAGFIRRNRVYFFKNDLFYKSYNTKTARISRVFGDLPSNIDAAFDRRITNKTYVFKNATYFVYDYSTRRIVITGRAISTDWDGLPGNLEGATMLDDNRVLFVKSNWFYVYSMTSEKIISDGNFSKQFLKCKPQDC